MLTVDLVPRCFSHCCWTFFLHIPITWNKIITYCTLHCGTSVDDALFFVEKLEEHSGTETELPAVGHITSPNFPHRYAMRKEVYTYLIQNLNPNGHIRLSFDDWSLSPLSRISVSNYAKRCVFKKNGHSFLVGNGWKRRNVRKRLLTLQFEFQFSFLSSRYTSTMKHTQKILSRRLGKMIGRMCCLRDHISTWCLKQEKSCIQYHMLDSKPYIISLRVSIFLHCHQSFFVSHWLFTSQISLTLLYSC